MIVICQYRYVLEHLRNIIGFLEDGNGGIISYLASEAVIKTVIQPFAGQRMTDIFIGILETCHGSRVNTGMIGSVVLSDIILQHLIKLIKGMDLSGVVNSDKNTLEKST